jgi:hypothetical protein
MVHSGIKAETNVFDEERYIAAAAIFDRTSSAIQRLTLECPWATVIFYPGRDYAVILVSVSDAQAWVSAARMAGARAWQVLESSELYRARTLDQIPRDPMPLFTSGKRGSKNLDHEEVYQDLLSGFFTDAELSEKYQVTRQTISNIRKKYRMPSLRPRAVNQTSAKSPSDCAGQ